MADSKISDLTAATSLAGTDLFVIAQEDTANKKVAAANMPGFEFDYVEITSPVTVTGTSAASPTTCITGNSVVYDGSTRVCVEAYCPQVESASISQSTVTIFLWDGSAQVGVLGIHGKGDGTRTDDSSHFSRRYLTPSAAAHTYSIRAVRSAADGFFGAGAGGDDTLLPAYMRITKA